MTRADELVELGQQGYCEGRFAEVDVELLADRALELKRLRTS
jgi:hypothetical protein